MPSLIATRTCRVGRVEYKPGEQFEVPTEKEAKGWVLVGKAKRTDVELPKPVDLPQEVMARGAEVPNEYETREMRGPSSRRGRRPRTQISDPYEVE